MTSPRRHFLKKISLGLAGSLGLNLKLSAKTTSVVLGIKTISFLPNLYHGWPTLARRSNGQLLVVCSGGREQHVCPFGRVELQRSDDNGKTWTFPRTILDGPIDDRDAGVLETAKGSILVTTFTSLAYASHIPNDDRRERWLAAHNRIPEKERQEELGEWMIRSTDGGITWSERIPTIVNSPHGPTQLSDGRLLYVGKRLWSEGKEVGVCESRDDGQSWQWLASIPIRVGDDHQDYHELHAVEAGQGSLIVHIRNHNKTNAGETLQCESHDGGETWSTPHVIGVWGLPSFPWAVFTRSISAIFSLTRSPSFPSRSAVPPRGGSSLRVTGKIATSSRKPCKSDSISVKSGDFPAFSPMTGPSSCLSSSRSLKRDPVTARFPSWATTIAHCQKFLMAEMAITTSRLKPFSMTLPGVCYFPTSSHLKPCAQPG